MTNFDQYFQTSAYTGNLPHRYDQFWNSALNSLKSFPINLKVTRKKGLFPGKSGEFSLTFDGYEKYNLTAKLFMPAKVSGKPPIVVCFPDYMQPGAYIPELCENGIAQLVLELRGEREALPTATDENNQEKQSLSHGYFSENMLDPDQYYVKKLYLDAVRCLEVVRLIKEVDKNRVSIWGKGIGATMALLLQNSQNRIASLLLDEPSFIYLELTQNISREPYAEEINQYIKKNKNLKKKIKESLAYFDPIYIANKIKIPIMMYLNIERPGYAPQGSFALFHRIPENKDMIISTQADDSNGRNSKNLLSEAVRFFLETLK